MASLQSQLMFRHASSVLSALALLMFASFVLLLAP